MRLYSVPFVSSLSTTEFITNDGPEKLYRARKKESRAVVLD